MPDRRSRTNVFLTRRLNGVVALAILLSLAGAPVNGQSVSGGQSSNPSIRAGQILDLSKYLASTAGAPDAYTRVVRAVFEKSLGTESKVTAYEENQSFVYAVAEMQSTLASADNLNESAVPCRWVRRVIILNASTFVIEDELRTGRPMGMDIENLIFITPPKVSGRTAHIADPSGEISAEIIFPKKAAYQIKQANAPGESQAVVLGTTSWESAPEARFVQILRVGGGPMAAQEFQADVKSSGAAGKLVATVGNKVFKLTLPPPIAGAGEISIEALDGKSLVANRPFPSGILPHGPEGNRLLELWDSDYRKPEPAFWDIGRPADELQKIVSAGTVPRCRVIDMCCGSGTDAIYLASKGFDVTAIDVAPTALGLALEKAAKARVSVNWVVGDILAPPDLKPFDFVYDRGCYHVVRDQNLAAYTETLRRLSHPASKFLLLASRRDDMVEAGHSGVTEEELRFDFLALFDLQWLHEIKLESNRPGEGPPGWSAFLIRKAAP